MSNEIPSTESPIQTQPEERTRTIGHYALGKSIGEGTFGKVKLGTHLPTGEKVAIKILEKDKITDVSDVERVAREIHILKLIRHPNIIQLYEIIETPKQLYLAMEYCNGGELFEYIVANNRIKEKEACRFFQQIISGVEYIHKLNVVHRDLKPENLLLDYNMNIKIVDFGLSNTYKDGQTLKTACGSPCYAAPEMIAGKRYNGLQVDIWSCGVILFAMLCGYLPFEDANTSNLYKKILSGDFQIPRFVSNEARDILKGILNTDPHKRFTVQDIRNHAWYNLIPNEREADGIIIGVNSVPVDHNIVQKLENLNISTSYAKKCIEANKHNHVTTSYYLMLQEHLRNGGKSDADMSSPDFVSTLLHPPQTEEGSSSSHPKRKTSEPSPITVDTTAVTPTHKLNQSLTPTLEADLKAFITKGKPQINVQGNLNLNNLDTSLTKEFDRTVLSNVSSAKNKPQVMSLSAKKERSDPGSKKERLDIFSQRDKAVAKKPLFSPTPKNEINLIHQRHTSNPDTFDPRFGDKDLYVEKPRKESEPAVHYPSEFSSRQVGSVDKSPNPTANRRVSAYQSERYHTEGYQHVITEAEIIYESLSSSRQTPDKATASSSTKYSENPVKTRKSSSPKPTSQAVGQSISGAKNLYAAYKNLTQKHGTVKSPRKAHEKSLNVSLDKNLKDNFIVAGLPKKSFISPRVSQEKQAVYNSLSNRKMLSTSQGFGTGALKEKQNNTTTAERLSSHTSGMKVYKGPFHLNSVTTKNPKFIMSELAKILDSHKIQSKNLTKYSLRCEKDANKFEVEINCLQNQENVYIVKFNKQSGDITKCNELCSIIYRGLDI